MITLTHTIKWLLAASLDWVIVVAAICLSFFSMYFLPLSVIIVGNRQHAISILGHDGAHYLVSRNRRLNNFLTNLFVFYPLGAVLNRYRDFHFAHHRNTNTPLDPEMPLKEMGPFPMAGDFSKTKVISHALLDLVGFGIPFVIRFLYIVRPRKVTELSPLVVSLVVTGLFIYNGLWIVPAIWYVSLLTSFWAGFRLRVWSEHVGLGKGETWEFQPNLLQRVLFLPHNTWGHAAHHRKPSIPFSDLPKYLQDTTPLCETRS
jgi:fatty acid desaturase